MEMHLVKVFIIGLSICKVYSFACHYIYTKRSHGTKTYISSGFVSCFGDGA